MRLSSALRLLLLTPGYAIDSIDSQSLSKSTSVRSHGPRQGQFQTPIKIQAQTSRANSHTKQKKQQGQQTNTQQVVECNPDIADIGILQCSVGQYCMESRVSKLGGYCLEKVIASNDRQLQGTVGGAGSFLPTSYCEPSSDDYGFYECDCSVFDVTTNTGSFTCTLYDDYCFTDETCGRLTVTNTLFSDVDTSNGSSDRAEYCGNFQDPFDVEICYSVDRENRCDIVIDGVSCDACEIVHVVTDSDLQFISYDCYQFDCTNTLANLAGNDCLGPAILETVMANGNEEGAIEVPSTHPNTVSIAPTTASTIWTTDEPTVAPTTGPRTSAPTLVISTSPTSSPTMTASVVPSLSPSASASSSPTVAPSTSPTVIASNEPTTSPSWSSSTSPALMESDYPSYVPSFEPTSLPVATRQLNTTSSAPSTSPSAKVVAEGPSAAPSFRSVTTNQPTGTNTDAPHCGVERNIAYSHATSCLLTLVPFLLAFAQ